MPYILKEGSDPAKAWDETPETDRAAILKQVEQKGYVVRTSDQEKEYVKNQVQSEVDKAYSKHASTIDSAIEEITGIKKNAEEKTTEYQKRALSEKLKVVKDLEGQINEYKTKGIDTNQLAQELKKQNEQLQQLVSQKDKEYSEKITGLQTEMFNKSVNSDVEKVLSEINPLLRTDVDKAILQDAIAARLAKFNAENKAKSTDAGIIWQDAQGNTRMGKKDGKPLTTKEVLEPYFDDYIDKGRKAGGAGSGKPGNEGEGKPASWKSLTVPTEVKSKMELWKWLKTENKLDENSKEFNEAYQTLGKDLPLERKI